MPWKTSVLHPKAVRRRCLSHGIVLEAIRGLPREPGELRYLANAGAITMGGVLGSGGFLPYDFEMRATLEPGQSAGFVVLGAGGGLADAARVFMNFLWYEESTVCRVRHPLARDRRMRRGRSGMVMSHAWAITGLRCVQVNSRELL